MRASEHEPAADQSNPVAPGVDLKRFEYAWHVRYSEVGHRGLMTLPALVNAFQDCSTFQSEALGIGMAWLKHEKRAWVLTHWHIVVDRYPSLCEEVSVGTFATGFKGVAALRNFYLKDGAGKLIARASSSWAFIDLEKGRPCRPAPCYTEPFGTHEPLELPAEARRVAVPDELTAAEPVIVRRGLIDTNEHVNNCQYVQLALDLLPRETAPHALRVDYRRAAVLGDTIYPKLAQTSERTVAALCDADGAPYAVVELA